MQRWAHYFSDWIKGHLVQAARIHFLMFRQFASGGSSKMKKRKFLIDPPVAFFFQFQRKHQLHKVPIVSAFSTIFFTQFNLSHFLKRSTLFSIFTMHLLLLEKKAFPQKFLFFC